MLYVLVTNTLFITILQLISSVSEKEFRACKTYGQSMLECHNILFPTAKVRVSIDLLLYPHMVLIGFENKEEDLPAWKCGGSLIGSLNLIAIGFGTTVFGVAMGSQTVMKIDVDIVDSKKCNKSMRYFIRRKILAHGITEDQLCAGDFENGGRDTCQGHFGGPLQVMIDRVDCINSFPLHTLVGVTSFPRDCGRKMAPEVYTKVSTYVEWIESIV